MFDQRGRVRSDSLEERAFIALSISMTTRLGGGISVGVCWGGGGTYIDREIVEAALALELVKISQPISGN